MSKVVSGISILLVAAVLAGCVQQQTVATSSVVRDTSAQQLVFLTREDCPASATMRANVDAALRALGTSADYAVIDLATLSERDPRGGYPTPTVLYANRDIFGMPEPSVPHPPAT